MSQQDFFLLYCPTYEDYLNAFITKDDLRFVRSLPIVQQLVKLNYRSTTTVYSREQFEQRKQNALESLFPVVRSVQGFSQDTDPQDPVIQEIAIREKPNLQKVLSTIIFITMEREGFEESSYMDLEDSIRSSGEKNNGVFWKAVFQERARIKPSPKHLSYFNFHKNMVWHNDSPNYRVLHDAEHGLTFMHKGDHKKICVSDKNSVNFMETTVLSPIYGFVKFFDHPVRKKI